jgi:hypothetical protein
MPTQSQSKTTTDHDEIRRWVEAHDGHPATVKRTARNGEPGLLRIDYPGYSGEGSLEPISWDEFFDKFEESQLAFVYQERKADGKDSRFSKLVSRANVADAATGSGARRRSSARAGQAKRSASTRSPKKAAGKSSAKSTSKTASASRAGKTRSASTRSAGKKTTGRAAAAAKGRSGGKKTNGRTSARASR